jgi:hypothetical protein
MLDKKYLSNKNENVKNVILIVSLQNRVSIVQIQLDGSTCV